MSSRRPAPDTTLQKLRREYIIVVFLSFLG